MLIPLMLSDAKYVLRRFSDTERETLTEALSAIISAWQAIYGGNSVEVIYAALDAEHGPLIDLAVELRTIDSGKPLPRLLAMLMLDAASKGDWLTVALAHRHVAESVANSKRKVGKRGGDALTRILKGFLASHPDATNDEVFEHALALANAGHPIFDEAEEAGCIEYRPSHDSIKCVVLDRVAFSKRMCKIRSQAF